MSEFVETNVLVAIMNDDLDDAKEQLATFLPLELYTFRADARSLVDAIEAEISSRSRGKS